STHRRQRQMCIRDSAVPAPAVPDTPAPTPAPRPPEHAVDRDATSGLPGSLSDQKTIPPPDLRGN
ncbi:hypothetical protein PP728_19170, partial [Ralstonia solanacearum]|nr:hypothetical protein [Ralstonia solanacearum]